MRVALQVVVLAKALRLLRGTRCRRFTTGSCRLFRHLRPTARYTADRWCESCLAADALERAGL